MWFNTISRRSVAVRFFLAAVVAVMTSLGSPLSQAVERYLVPDESASGPFYARLERGLVHMTDQWVAIAFYRDPGCVPPGFNLLDFFDFDGIPAIFSCPLSVHGFEVWKNGAASDSAPMQSKLSGHGAVPVWFVSAADFSAAIGDDVLSMTELEAIPSLRKGTATFFEETLHPFGAARQTMLHISAYGWLDTGASFQYQATEAAGVLRRVRIEIR